MPPTHSFLASVPKGGEPLLATELRTLGANAIRPGTAVVTFSGPLTIGLKTCLWSRIASRVVLMLDKFPAPHAEALYAGILAQPWEDHIPPNGTIAVECIGNSETLRNTVFTAQKVKDAIVDRLRNKHGNRPNVQPERPDVRIHLRLFGDVARVGIDLSGEGLHRRGYRLNHTLAPLKENLAATILTLAEWPTIANQGGGCVDPMCGSGTLLIEAAMMAGDIAPGLTRDYFGFTGWLGHDKTAWQEILAEAQERRKAGLPHIPPIWGWDPDTAALKAARENILRISLEKTILINKGDLTQATPPTPNGLLVVNPPYGQRLGEGNQLLPVYRQLGETLRTRFASWNSAVLTASDGLEAAMAMVPTARHELYNGNILCHLWRHAPVGHATETLNTPFANRLRKNFKHIAKWAKREGVGCYRVYDADMPEYAVAVDIYDRWALVQEYAPPPSVDAVKASERLAEAFQAVPGVLGLAREHVFLRLRRRQERGEQYEKLAATGQKLPVTENGLQFLVNLTDYLDTGIFLDQRRLRQRIRELAAGKRFLNLFGYTGAATVYAAAGGATATTTVDLSATYLRWADENLELNHLAAPHHRLIQDECLDWMTREPRKYDLIFLAPPTFSQSKRMDGVLDLKRDVHALITQAASLLATGGLLLFATHGRKVRIDGEDLPGLTIKEITDSLVSPDFQRHPNRQRVWEITRE